ncbi:tRNA 2-thiouridine(34) synthase MnmA [Nocardiopsis xinjiangensis]|uniref:tRNA 2-thiouridine(34) synthase MnmA n=1 Tax=Nocardiopsis xinjiangensis TaxID=124285 RepID=UPI0003451A25|nr:tRNA 2-thiouridine(34) synthase MnmA [Nocardiopsis xinjiangensis]
MTLRVLAAMSGGVDSAVAAARVAEAGHDVTGVHLALSKNPQSYRTGARGCCTVEDSHDARRAADVIGIPYYVWDMSEEFDREVVQDFVAEYEAGNTPNPCLRCNEKIKFEAVLDRAVALGFDAVATGHHVRKVDGRLVRSVDEDKDQSYVLGVLTADQLEHAMFPLGDCTKDEVRAEADRRGLSVADKPDSHDICFIADGDTKGFLNERIGARPGPIQDEDGKVLGTHDGSHTFTVGQRKGLGLGGAPDPRYVLSIEPVENTVTVGPRESLRVDEITGVRPVWSGSAPLAEPTECHVQLRAHGEVYPARVWQREAEEGPELFVRLAEPAKGVASGQAVVVYDDDTVLGSATIAGTARSERAESAGSAGAAEAVQSV